MSVAHAAPRCSTLGRRAAPAACACCMISSTCAPRASGGVAQRSRELRRPSRVGMRYLNWTPLFHILNSLLWSCSCHILVYNSWNNGWFWARATRSGGRKTGQLPAKGSKQRATWPCKDLGGSQRQCGSLGGSLGRMNSMSNPTSISLGLLSHILRFGVRPLWHPPQPPSENVGQEP